MISSLLFVFFRWLQQTIAKKKSKNYRWSGNFWDSLEIEIHILRKQSDFETNFSFWDKLLIFRQQSDFETNFSFCDKLLILWQTSHFETNFLFRDNNQILRQASHFETNFSFWDKIHIFIQITHSDTKFWIQILTFNLESFKEALEIKIKLMSQISIFFDFFRSGFFRKAISVIDAGWRSKWDGGGVLQITKSKNTKSDQQKPPR